MQVTRFPSRAEGLAERMAGFVAHLRMNGMVLGPQDTAAALEALSHVAASDAATARQALKSTLVADAEAWGSFDDLFEAYWFNAGKQAQRQTPAHVQTQTARPMIWQSRTEEGAEAEGSESVPAAGAGDAEGIEGRLLATRADTLRKRDLRELMDEDALRQAERVARDLARAIRDRRSRRRKRAARGQQLDLRRIQRASLARGGEPLDLFRRKRPDRPMQLLVFLDVSGSMTVYARVFLAFVKGLIDADTRADAYLFHTRLMRITPALRDNDTLRAAGRLSLMAEGFGGGTDIGGAFETFCAHHAARALNGRTVVLILSDGYCTGRPEALAGALQRMRRKARRIVWLNPLLGWRDYAPVAAGMQAAMPHLDAHLPANTLEALAALEPQFAKL